MKCDWCSEIAAASYYRPGRAQGDHACRKHLSRVWSQSAIESVEDMLACATFKPPDLNASGTSPHPPIVDEKPSGPPGGITSEGQAAYPRNDVLVREPPMCCGKPAAFRDSAPPYKGYECLSCRTYHSVLEEGAALTPLRTHGEQAMIDAGAPWTCPACHNQRGPSDFDGLTTAKKWDTDCWACGSKSAPIPPVSQQVGALPDTKSVEARIAGLKAAVGSLTATKTGSKWTEPWPALDLSSARTQMVHAVDALAGATSPNDLRMRFFRSLECYEEALFAELQHRFIRRLNSSEFFERPKAPK